MASVFFRDIVSSDNHVTTLCTDLPARVDIECVGCPGQDQVPVSHGQDSSECYRGDVDQDQGRQGEQHVAHH